MTLIFAGAVAIAGSPAHAQPAMARAAGAPDRPGVGSGPSPDQSDDIVVTASKREESVQRVGSTIAAFGSEALGNAGGGNVSDLVRIVPGLTFAISPNDTPVYTLRGVGFYESSLAASPAVSVYVDQIPLPFPALTPQAALDLERVEVLKGPQGILFGANSTGGAINYVAAKPTTSLEGGINVSYARFNTFEGTGYISGSLTPTLSARFSVKAVHGDDWQYSYTRDDSSGKKRLLVGRLLLDWQPADGVKLEMSATAWKNRSDPQAAQFLKLDPILPATVPAAAAAYPTAPARPRAADWSTNSRPSGDSSFWQIALRGDYALTDDVTLTTISSYAKYDQRQVVEGDGVNLTLLDINPVTGNIKTFFQEVRLANGAQNRFRWIAGGNFQRSRVFEDDFLTYDDSSVVPVFQFVSDHYNSLQKMRQFALFANGDYDLTDRLTLKAGVRYTKDRTSTASTNNDTGDGRAAAFFNGLQASLKQGSFMPIAPGGNVLLDKTTFDPVVYRDVLAQDNLSFRVGADFKLSPSILAYGNISRGYKTGGYPTLAASTTAALAPVTQESVLAYEAGLKAQLLGRALTLNMAGFYYDYSDKQLRAKLLDPVFGVLDALVNIPKSRVQGGEVSASLRPVSGLRFFGALTYVDSKITQFQGVNGAGTPSDFAGARVPYSPKWQGSGSVDYEYRLSSGWSVGAGASLSYNSSTSSIIGVDPTYRIRDFALLDLRAVLSAPDERLKLMIFGRNVTNRYYWTNVVKSYDAVVRFAGAPATYGVSLGYGF
ncbi:TonB-dependent receptor [Sphingobium sp. LB126]|uniref:TonB-dependent receptor n=1 Tax=Sphingobium sp. LB126 TaxID=1983755 RepID=UPI0012FE4E43|nr:TonB-dependent receptor [Sphingobium sp. LB126]